MKVSLNTVKQYIDFELPPVNELIERINEQLGGVEDTIDLSAKYKDAIEYQDKILEKVRSGYEVEDATISILAKEGKYNPTQPEEEKESAAGGSASTSLKGGGKTFEEMTKEEKRAALAEMESKGEFKL